MQNKNDFYNTVQKQKKINPGKKKFSIYKNNNLKDRILTKKEKKTMNRRIIIVHNVTFYIALSNHTQLHISKLKSKSKSKSKKN